jgi:peptide/nickel transport system substrate-binding protein
MSVMTLVLILTPASSVSARGTNRAFSRPAASSTRASGASCKKHTPSSGTVKASDWQFPDTLNPVQAQSGASKLILAATTQALFQYGPHGVFPQMATGLPTVANGGIQGNGRTIIVHLKRGLRWSNGAAITSGDVKFGWKAATSKNSGTYCKGTCDVIKSISTPDSSTVVFHLKRAYAPFIPARLPPIWPQSWAGKWSKNADQAAAILFKDSTFNFEGTAFPTDGPFQVTEFTRDDRVVLKAMRYYAVMNCGAHIATFIFAYYSSVAGMIAAAANKNTDITSDYTAADLPSLESHKSAFRVDLGPAYLYEFIEFNVDPTYNGQQNPLHTADVRLALALALDKLGLIRSALGLSPAQAKAIEAWTP